MSFSRRVKIKIWKTIENKCYAVSPSPTTYNMNMVWIVKVCLSEHNLSVAYLITFSMHGMLLNVKTPLIHCISMLRATRYFHSLSLPLSLVWFTPAVWGGSGGSLLMKEDDCLKSCDDECCRDDVEARETGVPVVYGRGWGAMAAIVNPLAAHLRRGERKVGKRRRIDHYSFSEPCRMPASYWIAANINYFMASTSKR